MSVRLFNTRNFLYLLFAGLVATLATPGHAETKPKPHPTAIKANAFAHALVTLSNHLLQQQAVITKESFGGYGGITNDLKFYKQFKNISKASNKVISIVQWETKHPENLHSVEVNIYDKDGRLLRDYSASYLPVYRRAPDQTLINIHHYENGLHSARQFNALDDILFEECSGQYQGQPISFGFDYIEMPDSSDDIEDEDFRQIYQACFRHLSSSAEPYTNPLVEINSDN